MASFPGQNGELCAEAEWPLEAGSFARRVHGGNLGCAADCARDHAARRRSRYPDLVAIPRGGADARRRARCAWAAAEALRRRERGEDPPRAWELLGRRCRRADEDPPPAWRVAGTGDVVRAADGHAVDRRLRAPAAHARTQRGFVACLRPLHERHAYQLRPGLQRERELLRTGGGSSASTATRTAPTSTISSTPSTPVSGPTCRDTWSSPALHRRSSR